MQVLRGDIPIVRQFVKAGMPIDTPNHNGWAAIHIACLHNYSKLVGLLAGAAAKLNTAEPQTGMTPLVIAAKQGYVEIVSQLLEIGVELDEADNNGVTALQSACSQGRFDIVSMMLDQGASTVHRTNDGDTALTTAVQANFQDIVARLIRHGVDAESVDQFWPEPGSGGVMWSPMQLTARLGFMSVAEVLWRQGKADVNRTLRDEGGLTWTTLSIAASRNRLDMCKLLLRGRARVYPTNEDGRQAVWFAARDGYSAVAMALIEGGGNAGMADVDGLTPALAAALYGHADTVKRILRYQVAERREDLEAKERQKLEDEGEEDPGPDGLEDEGSESDDSFDAELEQTKLQKMSSAEVDPETVGMDDLLVGALGPSRAAGLGLVLRTAVLREDFALLELALRLGADPESEDDQYRKCGGQWALEQAVAHGRIEVLVRVARTGAAIFHRMPRPEEPDQREISAYSYAIHSRIRPGGADTEAPFPTGRPGTLAAGVAVRPGLKQEVDSCVDPLGRTPLIYACQLGNERWVRDLLDAGADIQAVDSDGFSCIHAAAYSGRLEILRHLLPLADAAGMAVDAQIIDGRTTMDLAKDGRFLPDPRVAELLQDYGVAGLHLSKDKNKLAAEHQAAMRAAAKKGEWRPLTLAVRIPTAATHSAISILGLLWTSLSVHEVPWQLAYVTVRCFPCPTWRQLELTLLRCLCCCLCPVPGCSSRMQWPVCSSLAPVSAKDFTQHSARANAVCVHSDRCSYAPRRCSSCWHSTPSRSLSWSSGWIPTTPSLSRSSVPRKRVCTANLGNNL